MSGRARARPSLPVVRVLRNRALREVWALGVGRHHSLRDNGIRTRDKMKGFGKRAYY